MTPASPVTPDLASIHGAVLDWYATHGRALAFRATRDPWAILVSEAMTQQTQAERAAEAWLRFMAEFPTVEALASATPAAVLRAWRGLGYNRRALALRDAARRIVEDHGGRVPEDVATLRSLPGIGPYTARAVAALAFGQPQAAVDTNVARVLGRALGAATDGEPVDRAELQRLADAALPAAEPGAWTHALMDVGATLCRIRAPRCEACPLRPWCGYAIARAAEDQAEPAAASRPARTRPGRGRARPDGADSGLGRGRSRPGPAFPSTNRWLRGRILDRLRDAPDGGWLTIDGRMGAHDGAAVVAALEALAVERLLEIRRSGTAFEARLPVA
ncbi:MAG: A/G-specific adenine glycosylase [Chloroflexota bacterium]